MQEKVERVRAEANIRCGHQRGQFKVHKPHGRGTEYRITPPKLQEQSSSSSSTKTNKNVTAGTSIASGRQGTRCRARREEAQGSLLRGQEGFEGGEWRLATTGASRAKG